MTPTIKPEPCGRVFPSADHPRIPNFRILPWTCGKEHLCSRCTPLGERLQGAAYDCCEFSNVWYSFLAWNLTIAAVACTAAERGREEERQRRYDEVMAERDYA